MKIIVCCKAVPGAVHDVRVGADGKTIDYRGDLFSINECDEGAVEEAVSLKRALGAELTVMTLGSIRAQNILYLGLAKGADRAVRVDAQVQDPQLASRVIAAAVSRLGFDLILTGTQSRDTLAGQVGISMAEQLKIPYSFAVVQVEVLEGRGLRVRKELGGGSYADVALPLPALLCVQTGIRPISYVPPARLLRARQQPVRSLSLSELGFDKEQLMPNGYRFLSVFRPERLAQAQWIEGQPGEIAAALLAKIREVL